MRKLMPAFLVLTVVLGTAVACSGQPAGSVVPPIAISQPEEPLLLPVTPAIDPPPVEPEPAPVEASPQPVAPEPTPQVVSDPAEITVLVNKQYRLPAEYRPDDLVIPNVPFLFTGADDRRLMRREAAQALESMVEAAEQSGIYLAAASGYRSYETQHYLFNHYMRIYGEDHARRYSAEPGHSEHQTGLAMDVSGRSGACAIDDCFAGTPEAEWLKEHAHRFGFIIRYPAGKESITGYAYEPWHLRFTGTAVSQQIFAKRSTLEEYYGTVAPDQGRR